METALVILSVGILVFLGHFFSALFEKTRVPDVLPLLLLGVLFGPLLGWVTPGAFGKVGGIFTTVALIVILFQSGLGLKIPDLKKSLGTGLGLTLVGYFLTVITVAVLADRFLPLNIIESLILGSVLGGTSSAVVIPIIEKVRLGNEARTSLLLESTFSDVLCIVGTLGLLQYTAQPDIRFGAVAGNILSSFLLASLIGAAGGFAWSLFLARIRRLENSTFLTPAFVFILFGVAELLGYSGAIVALAFGIVLGNGLGLPFLRGRLKSNPVRLNEMELSFFSEVVFLLKTFFFVYIGLSLRLSDLNLLLCGLGITLVLFLLRILVVRLSLSSKANSRWDASVAAVLNPKGLAAAVLAGIPLEWGLPGGAVIQSVVYAAVLFSILVTAVLIPMLSIPVIQKTYSEFFRPFKQDPLETSDPR